MSFIEGSQDGTLNGTGEVTVVSSPAANTRRLVRNIIVYNRDTAPVTVTVKLAISPNIRRFLWTQTIQPNGYWNDEVVHVLDTTQKSIVATMSGPPATTNPDVVAVFADAS